MSPAVWRFDAIGTAWEIVTPGPIAAGERDAVSRVIAEFDADWSRFRPDSVVSRLSLKGGSVPAPPDAEAMLALAGELSVATAGGVNPLIGDSLSRLGYDADITLKPTGSALPAPVRWREILSWDETSLRLARPGTIDVGAMGKGRLVDLVCDEIAGPVVVDASGDIRVRGMPQRIALEHPYDSRTAIGVVEIDGEALCASATNRRAWGNQLHHVLDGRTGEPVREIAATWAIAPDAMTADAAATGLFFDGGPQFAHERGVHWVRMFTDGRAEWSLGDRVDQRVAEVFA
ncbi:FAD:protein FMN transferase [Microbacterium amylolyticum]|uniref:FAD:protein FMN transferase n=1 Tax=Microbacterium amylolyticum TaxID=936337 RepID=A0ABS4ZK65_9MICO|nr:FAD:protein FMN transferase [Microbacterium amylolyticum]MBP2437681.1 thiamine biosynthesis lipoprotein [Microbacterium amylolyticum]